MKKYITCLIIIFTLIFGTDISFAKKAPVGKIPEANIQQDENAEEENSKEENAKEDTVKKETKKINKQIKKEAKKEAEKNKASLQKTTTIELTRKRSAFSIYMNPNLDVQEIRASHILVKKRKDAVKIRKDILSNTITFEDAAREYSLCPTGVKGGDLGYFNRKRMDQNFADRAFDLKVGEISEPVGTKFGWHLIKVFDKR